MRLGEPGLPGGCEAGGPAASLPAATCPLLLPRPVFKRSSFSSRGVLVGPERSPESLPGFSAEGRDLGERERRSLAAPSSRPHLAPRPGSRLSGYLVGDRAGPGTPARDPLGRSPRSPLSHLAWFGDRFSCESLEALTALVVGKEDRGPSASRGLDWLPRSRLLLLVGLLERPGTPREGEPCSGRRPDRSRSDRLVLSLSPG